MRIGQGAEFGHECDQGGSAEDAKAFAIAQIVNTNGDTNIIFGSVERTGVLWAENIPLSNGTNWLSLAITNFAGLSSITNIILVKSDMTLVLTNIQGDLWLPTVNVSGLVSDTTAAIWVNGVHGTNYGNGTWRVINVPVSSSGIASFDMNAIPEGDDDPTSNTNATKDGETILESAKWNIDSEADTDAGHGGFWEVFHVIGNYTHVGGGTFSEHFEEQDSNRVTLYTYDDTYTFAAGGRGIVVSSHFSDSDGADRTSTNNLPNDLMTQDDGTLSYPPDIYGNTWSKTSKLKFKYEGGGGGGGGESIYPVSGTAVSEPKGIQYTPDQITVAGEQLDLSDALAFKADASGASFDLPLTQPAPMATITAGAVEHKLISEVQCIASGDTNVNRQTIGVGEKVDCKFNPPLLCDWNTSAGSLSYMYGVGTTTLTAPATGGSAKVTATVRGGKSAKITFGVVEPKGYDSATIISRDPFNIGDAGAGMHLHVIIGPTTVSFHQVQIMEVGQDATDVTGWFVANGAPSHIGHGADAWISLSCDNSWDDHAWSPTYSGFYPAGGYTWEVPTKWKVGDGPEHSMSSWSQNFSFSSDGTVTVSKFGDHHVTRHVNQIYGTAQ